MDYSDHLIEDQAVMLSLLRAARHIAVLGIKTEKQVGQPSFDVPAYLAHQGYEVIPVPVYYPEVIEILGQPVYRRLEDVPGTIDIVDVFRRAQDIPAHIDDIISKHPVAVWFQLGIRNDTAAARLAQAGIKVVQDRCIMVEHRRLLAVGHSS